MSLIEKIYDGQNIGRDAYKALSSSKREESLYVKLKESLSEEQMALLNEFMEEVIERMGNEQQRAYRLGFQTGMKITIEVYDQKTEED